MSGIDGETIGMHEEDVYYNYIDDDDNLSDDSEDDEWETAAV